MTTFLKMNRNRRINIPAAFVAMLNLGEGRYFKAEIQGNKIILIPIDPVERVFSEADLNLAEATYQKEKHLAKPVTPSWIKKTHHLK